jgi:glycosyltransferase involved in cell wall biosynthesis
MFGWHAIPRPQHDLSSVLSAYLAFRRRIYFPHFVTFAAMLERITPLILTYNEEANIGRCLEKLGWAREIVVVDSFSADRTLEIVRRFGNARLVQRKFMGFSDQWNFSVAETGIRTDWILGLDADFILSGECVAELESLVPPRETAAYKTEFRFCIFGKPLPQSILPGRVVLFRRGKVRFEQDGHAHKAVPAGEIAALRKSIDLDDRKPVSRWMVSQDKYAQQERDKLLVADEALGLPDRLRWRLIPAPLLVLVYCLVFKRLAFAGLPGWFYTYQRVLAEIMLSLYLMEARLSSSDER